jgi:hypothetical protein
MLKQKTPEKLQPLRQYFFNNEFADLCISYKLSKGPTILSTNSFSRQKTQWQA